MIDHFTLSVSDMDRSKAFYTEALKPLGYSVRMDFGDMVGFGDTRKPYLWLKRSETPTGPMHIAFVAKDRKAVDAFHAAALKAGARDDGNPGLRADYHANYYAAFVVELDGHPLEAVCHQPIQAAAKSAKVQKASRRVARKATGKPARSRKATARKKPAGRKAKASKRR